jgi:hypothetical protein
MERKIAGFEVINNSGFETENLFGKLINEEKIQRRLKFIADQTLHVLKEIQLFCCTSNNFIYKFWVYTDLYKPKSIEYSVTYEI